MIRALARTVRNAARSGVLWQAPGHFYSPATSREDRRRQIGWDREAAVPPGVDLNPPGHERTAVALAGLASTRVPKRWTEGNPWFSNVDAGVLHAFLVANRPPRIVEIGSGYSTAVMLDAADSAGTTRDITCIEPYPGRLRSLLLPEDDVRIVENTVQGVDLDVFASLDSGDLLFIDSTHVAKAGSDVLRLYLDVLPRLRSGVLVHAHDIFWPFSYPAEWHEEGRDWTEAYFLRALLVETTGWEIVWFGSWVWSERPDLARQVIDEHEREGPGSIYLRRL